MKCMELKMNKYISKEQRKYNTVRIYNKEYDDCPTNNLRNKKMANLASDNGRCWWIYTYIMSNETYRSENGNNRR